MCICILFYFVAKLRRMTYNGVELKRFLLLNNISCVLYIVHYGKAEKENARYVMCFFFLIFILTRC